MQDGSIDAAAAADYLGVSRRTLRRLVSLGLLVHSRTELGYLRFERADLDAYTARVASTRRTPKVVR